MGIAFLGVALVLGTEPRLVLERTGNRIFRATGSNHFSGIQFFTKTIEGVTEVLQDDAVRDGRHDSAYENRKRRKDRHLDLFGAENARLGWDRESDQSVIEAFMRGNEPKLSLEDKPPMWRMGIAWFMIGLGALTLLGAIQSFFPKKAGVQSAFE
jgi:hypothetical protein